MTFTYDLGSDDADIVLISKIRLELGDTDPGAGVRPNQSNLADEEIQSWLDSESNDIMRTVGRAALSLSSMWATFAKSITTGPYKEDYGNISDTWAKRAQFIFDTFGEVSGIGGLQSAQLGKVDGYSENNSMSGNNTEYTPNYEHL